VATSHRAGGHKNVEEQRGDGHGRCDATEVYRYLSASVYANAIGGQHRAVVATAGCGGWFVRLTGRIYEAIYAFLERRRPLDLFTVETALLQRLYVLFVIELGSP
jgi:hypothetical protein